MNIFNLPDLGEGLAEAEIVSWYVREGEVVELDQPLVSMETAKAVVEVPSPMRAKIIRFYGGVGDIIKTGTPLVEFQGDTVKNTKRDTNTVAGKIEQSDQVLEQEAMLPEHKRTMTENNIQAVKATPAVRSYAKKQGVNLLDVTPSGKNSMLTLEDINNQIRSGSVEMTLDGDWKVLKGVRRAMAQTMTKAHKVVVPVTVVDDVILPESDKLNDITIKIIQAMCKAAQKEPPLNAWYDGVKIANCLKSSIDLGIAMDTPDGLFVPVIRETNSLDAKTIREKLDNLKEQVHSRTISQSDLTNPSIVLSNFGKFSGRYATPVVVPPTVAILAVGKLRKSVVAESGKMVIRSVLPLALTVDHRAITGGEATRFLDIVMEELKKT